MWKILSRVDAFFSAQSIIAKSREDDWSSMDPEPRVRSIPDSRNRLLSVLNTLSVLDGPKKSSMPRAKKVSNGSKFTSSRERKAANKKTNKTKKKKRYL